MGSAGKWVLGLLLLVVGAVFVARAVSSDPESQATVKNNLQADPASAAKANDAADAAKQKKIASTTAGDVSCKKACIEVNEVANDSVTTAKLAPGSVTLSKLAFEVPNLNELENEINARKAAEAQVKAAAAGLSATTSELAAATAKNDAAITAAAANGLTVEAAARTAADEDLAKKSAAADADLLSKLNTEVTSRGAADDVLQSKLNTEIADRAAGISGLRAELINPNQVASPIVQINNNEIVGNAVTTDKILADTILANDLATGSVTTDEILEDTVAAVDLANNSVVGRAAGETLTNTKARTLRGERETNSATAVKSAGDLALGTLTGEDDNDTTRTSAVGNIGLRTVGRNNLVNGAVDNSKLNADAVTTDKILDGQVQTSDINDNDVTNAKLRTVDAGGLNGAVSTNKINDGAVTFQKLDGSTQTRINNLETGLANEITARILDVDTEEAARILDVNTEEAARILDVDTEEAARIAADTALQTALNTEIANRIAGDNTVQTNLNTEIANRTAKDALQDTALTDEITARTAKDALQDTALSDFKALLVNDEPGATAPKEPNDGDGLVHWNNLESVPNDIADGDDDGNGRVNDLKSDLETADATGGANDGDGLVDFTNIDGVVIDSSMLTAGSVSGGAGGTIVDGSITADDLAGVDDADPGTPGPQGVVAGAVNTEKILDLTIQARDLATDSVDASKIGSGQVGTDELAAGAVTTDKQTANVAFSTDTATPLLTTPVPPGGESIVPLAPVTLTVPAGANHQVLLTANALATCGVTCTPGPGSSTVTYQLVEDVAGVLTPLSPAYTATASTGNVSTPMSISFVHTATPGAHSYKLRVTQTGAGVVSNVILNAVDLGRA